MDAVLSFVAQPAFLVGASIGVLTTAAITAWRSLFVVSIPSRGPSLKFTDGKAPGDDGVLIERVVYYELANEEGFRDTVNISGFCNAVRFHLNAMTVPVEIKTAFKDKFPPHGKAPFVDVHFSDGTSATIAESDQILRFLNERARDHGDAACDASAVIAPDDDVASAERRSSIHLIKRLVTDRLYFVGMIYGCMEDTEKAKSEGLLGAYIRKLLVEQCLGAAGGIGRLPYSEVLAEADRDLDAMEEMIGRLTAATGFLSGLDRPSSAEVALFGHLVVLQEYKPPTPLSKATEDRGQLWAWLNRMRSHILPE